MRTPKAKTSDVKSKVKKSMNERTIVQDQRVLRLHTPQHHLSQQMVKVKQTHLSMMKRAQVVRVGWGIVVREYGGLFKCAVRPWSTGAGAAEGKWKWGG